MEGFLNSLKSMYSSLMACVRANGELSEWFECPNGVRQGCVLSPTLFSLFINQLALDITQTGRHGIQLLPGLMELFILLFADDVVLMSTTPIGLQHQLKECCEKLKLVVNQEKNQSNGFQKRCLFGKKREMAFRRK